LLREHLAAAGQPRAFEADERIHAGVGVQDAQQYAWIDRDLGRLALVRTIYHGGNLARRAQTARLVLAAPCSLLCLKCCIHKSVLIVSCQLPVASCQLPVTSCRLPVAGYQLPVPSCRLPVAGGGLRVHTKRYETD